MRSRVIALLWNSQSARPRLPWRLAAAFLVLVALGLGASWAGPALRDAFGRALSMAWPGRPATAATDTATFVTVQLVVSLGTVALAGRLLDRRRLRDFGLRVDRGWLADLGFGLALGAALMAAIFAVELAAGWVVVTDTYRVAQSTLPFRVWLALGLLTFATIGLTEELLTRGYLLTNLAEGLTWFDRIGPTGAVWLGVLATSLLFGWGHVANPNAGLGSAIGVTLAAVMLAAGYVLTGELAVPIGIHVSWNFFQGPVFGLPVSGIDFGVSVLAVEQRGPDAITGGVFGPEAGLLGMGASVLGLGAVVIWAGWREGAVRIHPSLTAPGDRDRE